MKNNSLLSGASWAVSTQGIRIALALILIPVIVANLGIEGYGNFVALSIISIYQGFANFAELGYTTYITSLFLKDDQNQSVNKNELIQKLKGYLFYIFIINIIGIIFFVLIGTKYSNQDILYSGIIILISNFFSIYFIACSSIFIGHNKLLVIKKIEIYSYIIYALFVISLLPFSKSLITLSVIFLLFQLISALIIGIQVRRIFGDYVIPKHIKISKITADWSNIKPFFWIKVNGTAMRSTDNIFILLILGSYELGIYDLILKIPHAIKVILGKISEALGPYLFRRSTNKVKTYHEIIIENLLAIEIALGAQIFILMYFYGEIFIKYLFNIDSNYVNLFIFAILINIINPINSVCSQAVLYDQTINNKLSKFGLYNSLLNLSLIWPITYLYGITGALYLMLLQYFLSSVIAFNLYRINFHINFNALLKYVCLFAFVCFSLQFLINNLLNNTLLKIFLSIPIFILFIHRRLLTLLKLSKIY